MARQLPGEDHGSLMRIHSPFQRVLIRKQPIVRACKIMARIWCTNPGIFFPRVTRAPLPIASLGRNPNSLPYRIMNSPHNPAPRHLTSHPLQASQSTSKTLHFTLLLPAHIRKPASPGLWIPSQLKELEIRRCLQRRCEAKRPALQQSLE